MSNAAFIDVTRNSRHFFIPEFFPVKTPSSEIEYMVAFYGMFMRIVPGICITIDNLANN